MEYKLGNSTVIKSRGKTARLLCPNCAKESEFGVFSNYDCRLTFKSSLFDCSTVYFSICPNCASMYALDESTGELFKNGETAAITANDLKPMKDYKSDI